MPLAIDTEEILVKILEQTAKSDGVEKQCVILVSKGIYESEAKAIETDLQTALHALNLPIEIQWRFTDTGVRCGLCHSVFQVKRLNAQTLLCPLCEFKSVDLLAEKSLQVLSVIG